MIFFHKAGIVLSILVWCSAPVLADSNGKFPGKGDIDAFNRTHDLMHEGNKCVESKSYDKAIQLYRRCISIYPFDSASYANLGSVLRKNGQFEEAVTAEKEAIRLEPSYLGAWTSLGLAYSKLGNLSEAERCYRRSAELSPDTAVEAFNLGNTLLKEKRIPEARTWLTKAKACKNSQDCLKSINEAIAECDDYDRKNKGGQK